MQSSSFESSNHDEALAYVRDAFDTNFRAEPTDDPFYLKHRRANYGPWTSDTLQFQSGGFSAQPYGVVSICRMRSGRVAIATGRDELLLETGDVFVMADAAEEFTACWSRADCTMLRVPVSALQRAADGAAGHHERDQFAFLSRRPVTAHAARRWTRVVDFAQRHLADGDALPAPAVLDAIGNLLAASMLETFPNTLVTQSSAFQARSDVPATLALALDFISRNADLQITLSDVAAFASVSPRALQMAFRDHLGMTPTAYIRQFRLLRIRDELARAAPGPGVSVTQVAGQWGFPESSRLAAQYRDAFGELPSHTLRRDPAEPLHRSAAAAEEPDGQADAANRRITDALGIQDAGQDPGGEGDGDSKQAL